MVSQEAFQEVPALKYTQICIHFFYFHLSYQYWLHKAQSFNLKYIFHQFLDHLHTMTNVEYVLQLLKHH